MSKSNDVVVLTAGLGGVGEEEGVSMVDGAVCGAVHWWYGWCGRGTGTIVGQCEKMMDFRMPISQFRGHKIEVLSENRGVQCRIFRFFTFNKTTGCTIHTLIRPTTHPTAPPTGCIYPNPNTQNTQIKE